MKSLLGRLLPTTIEKWLVLPLVVALLCVAMATTASAGWGHHRAGVYGHPRAYISTYVPWGSYSYWGPDVYWGPYGYRPHRVYKKIYRIYHPRPWW